MASKLTSFPSSKRLLLCFCSAARFHSALPQAHSSPSSVAARCVFPHRIPVEPKQILLYDSLLFRAHHFEFYSRLEKSPHRILVQFHESSSILIPPYQRRRRRLYAQKVRYRDNNGQHRPSTSWKKFYKCVGGRASN